MAAIIENSPGTGDHEIEILTRSACEEHVISIMISRRQVFMIKGRSELFRRAISFSS